MAKVLDGIRVVEYTIGQHGPVATAMLADMGAEVIKIEEPTKGDLGRRVGVATSPSRNGLVSYFENNNRGKKSVALDMEKKRGQEVLYRLIPKADVFATNLTMDVVERCKIDYPTLLRFNPRLIYASASAFGHKGPDMTKRGVDAMALARGGLLSVSGSPNAPPVTIGAGIADQVGAFIFSYGILLAILARERLGVVQEVNTSLLGSQLALGSLPLQNVLLYGEQQPRRERSQAMATWNYYKCSDNRWAVVSELPNWVHQWPGFCKALGTEKLQDDPRFNTMEKRIENAAELIAIWDGVFATRPSHEWVSRLEAQNIKCGRLNDYVDVTRDPQVLANEYIVEVDHHAAGKIKMVGLPVKLSKTPGEVKDGAPDLGQHTEEVLSEVGYSQRDMERLRTEGVIR